MSGPWEKYGGAQPANTTPAGPWEKYAAQPAAPAGPQLDAAHQQARDYLNAHPEARPGKGISLLNKVGQGVTMGWGDEAAAGLKAAAGAVGDAVRGFGNPNSGGPGFSKRYELEKAMQDELLKDAADKTGALGTAAEIAGGVGGGVLAAGALPVLRGTSVLSKIGLGAAEGAGYGAVSGAGMADSGKRLQGAGTGAAIGGALGGALPAVVEVVRHSPVQGAINTYKAWRDPRGFAEGKVLQSIERSGQSFDDLTNRMTQAAQEGQGNYVLADALGPSGGKQLSSLVKQPGDNADAALQFLRDRQTDSGRRLSGFVSDAFEAPQTAEQFRGSVTAAREAADAVNYPAAAEGAGRVDMNPVADIIESIRNPSGVPGQMPVGQSEARPSVERVLRLIDGVKSGNAGDFNAALDAKQQIGDAIGEAVRAGRTYEASQLMQVKQALDEGLSNASSGYRAANDTHAGFRQIERAVDAGADVTPRARPQDVINDFNNMSIGEQQGFRHGYADRLISGMGGKPGVNKAAPLTGDFAQQEIGAFAAPGRADQLLRQIQREDQMSNLYSKATGGSPTFELFANAADGGQAASAAQNALSGNVMGMAKDLGSLLVGGGGNTEGVRSHIIDILLNNRLSQPSPVTSNPTGVMNFIDMLRRFEAAQAAGAATGQNIRHGVMGGVMPSIMDAAE